MISPRAARIVVDFPEPFGPTSPVTSPWWTVNDKSSTAVTDPKRLVSRSTISDGHGSDGTDRPPTTVPPQSHPPVPRARDVGPAPFGGLAAA